MEIDDLLDLNKSSTRFELKHRGDKYFLYLARTKGEVSWKKLFDEFDIDSKYFRQNSAKGVLLIRFEERYLAFTFGYGRALLNLSSFEKGFGLRVAMNLGDPNQIKSIDKATLDKVARNTRSQVSVNSGVEDFDFEFDHEILKSLTAIVDRADEELELISGNDSVSIYTELSFEILSSLGERLLKAYDADDYKERYPWAEFIGIETDPETRNRLDEMLVSKLDSGDLSETWIAAPNIVNYHDFTGFVYNLKPKKGCSICRHPELDLVSFLEEAPFRKPLTISSLKSKKIYLLNGDDRELESWKLYDTINAEVVLDNTKYVINDGRWYRIKDSFSKVVEDYFQQMLSQSSELEFPLYHDKSETDYLRRVADGQELALLDQKWVYPKETKQRIEFCDLLSQCNAIIHVKRYGSSSVFSHLFSQATIGLDLLLYDEDIKSQVHAHLDDTYLSFKFDSTEPRGKYRIVLAIIYHKEGGVHMPFFSKVNLRHHARNMESKGFKVELAKINIDQNKHMSALST